MLVSTVFLGTIFIEATHEWVAFFHRINISLWIF